MAFRNGSSPVGPACAINAFGWGQDTRRDLVRYLPSEVIASRFSGRFPCDFAVHLNSLTRIARHQTVCVRDISLFPTSCSLTTLSLPDRPWGFSRGPTNALPAFTRNRTAASDRSGTDPVRPFFHARTRRGAQGFHSDDFSLRRSAAGTWP